MKKIYYRPTNTMVELDNEDAVMLITSGKMKLDHSIKVDQLTTQKDMWGNEDIWK